MPKLPLNTRVAASTTAVVLLAIAGCFSSHTTRDADLVQVWPPLDEDAPQQSSARREENPSRQASPAEAPSPYGEEVIVDRTARLPSASAATTPAVATLSDPRLTAEQRELLGAQLASWPTAGSPASAAPPTDPANPAGATAAPPTPLAGQGMQSYFAPRLVPGEAAGAAAPTANPAAAAPSDSAATPPTPATSTPAATTTSPNAAPPNAAPPASALAPSAAPAGTTTAAPAASAPAAAAAAATATPAASSAPAPTTEPPAAPPAEATPSSSPETAATSAEGSTEAAASAAAATPAEPEHSSTAGAEAAKPLNEGQPPAQHTWREHLDESITALEQQLAAAELEETERLRLESTLRLMYVAAGRREDAVRTIEVAETREQEFWKQCVFALLELVAPEGPPVASRRAKLALRPLREALQQLAAVSSLDVRNLAICQKVESFGRYTEFTPYEFRPEQEVILYVEVSNFASEATAEGYETEFHGSYQILDSAGRRLVDYDLMRDQQICRNVRTDYFLPYRIYMPKTLAPGGYQLQVTIEDKKGQKFGQTPPVEFKISG